MKTYEYVTGCRGCGATDWEYVLIDGEAFLADCVACVRRMAQAKRYYGEKHARLIARVASRKNGEV
jgi:hypothetical protein